MHIVRRGSHFPWLYAGQYVHHVIYSTSIDRVVVCCDYAFRFEITEESYLVSLPQLQVLTPIALLPMSGESSNSTGEVRLHTPHAFKGQCKSLIPAANQSRKSHITSLPCLALSIILLPTILAYSFKAAISHCHPHHSHPCSRKFPSVRFSRTIHRRPGSSHGPGTSLHTDSRVARVLGSKIS